MANQTRNEWVRRARRGWVMCALLAGCRFGGPATTDDPGPAVPDEHEAGTGPDVQAPGAPDQAVPMRGEVQPPSSADAQTGGEPLCGGPFVSETCDPVCNMGCPSLSRCDVSDKPRTGACVGIWISGENESCVIKGATTDQCAAQLTCLDGACRRLCYRDSDCKLANTCCSQSVDVGGVPSGFKVCAPCAP